MKLTRLARTTLAGLTFSGALLLASCQSVPDSGGELQRAIDLYTGVAGTVDDARAATLLERAVARDEPLAVMWLARVYSTGRMGFPADRSRARSIATTVIDEIEHLADTGHPEAAFLMGTAFAEGLGRETDAARAVQWYRRAAGHGHVLAQHNLGNVYFSGTGVEQSDEMAVHWWRLAAQQGDAIPQFRLGEMLEQGRGTTVDREAALRWYREAASRGNANASAALARLAEQAVADRPTEARAVDGAFISWREHLIDDPAHVDFVLSGGDGLVMGDLDRDDFPDIVSVHESDSSYDSASFKPGFEAPPEGHVRIAFGSDDPHRWHNITVAEGLDAAAPEDAALADVNGDGFPDILVAAELSHVLYLQNPGRDARETDWQRLKLPMTRGRGSYIRVFAADLDGDGTPEVIAPNKGAQIPGPEDFAVSHPASIFQVQGNPLQGENWREIELGRYSIPQNSEPVDLDGDGDVDIVVGTRGEERLVWFENPGDGSLDFTEHAIGINGARMAGFNLEYADLNGDGRLDIIGVASGRIGDGVAWIEQPARQGDAWNAHFIGTFAPDILIGLETADIDGDGDTDVFAGSYSRGDRESDDASARLDDPLGRLGWFQHPGDPKAEWTRHDVSRRKRGMFDKFVAHDMDGDGDVDFAGTRGNSYPYDGVFWLEQVRSGEPRARFEPARTTDSEEVSLP